MDPKELEEKLERDNLTLKEHIMKLQNTIKHIKTEIVSNNNNDKEYSHVHKSKPLNDQKYEDNYLKFSFNNNTGNNFNDNGLKYLENNRKSIEREKSNTKENIMKKNIYHDNFEKLRKEKDIITQMENVKKKANLRKNFSDEEIDENEIDKFHQNYNNYSILKRTLNKDQSDEENDSTRRHVPTFNNSNFYFYYRLLFKTFTNGRFKKS